MKKYCFTCVVLCLMVVFTLSACAQPSVVEESVDEAVPTTELAVETDVDEPEIGEPEQPVEEETPVPEDEETPTDEAGPDEDEDERMKALISEKIGGCHMLDFILRQNKTREEWSTTIDRMIGKGAQVNAEEKELIIDWLVSREE
jgi:hypothetical protein